MLITISLHAQSDSSHLVLQHVNLIDGFSRKALPDQTVTIRGGKIVGIAKKAAPAVPGAVVIDLRGQWLLPGYVDAHVHFGSPAAAQAALRKGVTTARTMNTFHYQDVTLRERHKAGGYQLRPDMFDAFFKDFPALTDLKPRVTGTENVRRLVRANVERGVNHIKILATERAGTPETDPRKRTFTDEELLAIVDEARKAGIPVVAHAHGDEGARQAVEAGVRSIEHGTYLSDKTLQRMKAKGTYLVATNALYGALDTLPMIKNNPVLVNRNREMVKQALAVMARAHKMGVLLVGATDTGYDLVSGFTVASEAATLVQAGLLPMEAIKAITSLAAQLLQVDSYTGSIREGLDADLVVLSANPLEDIRALQGIQMVINNGRIEFRGSR